MAGPFMPHPMMNPTATAMAGLSSKPSDAFAVVQEMMAVASTPVRSADVEMQTKVPAPSPLTHPQPHPHPPPSAHDASRPLGSADVGMQTKAPAASANDAAS